MYKLWSISEAESNVCDASPVVDYARSLWNKLTDFIILVASDLPRESTAGRI